MQITKIRGATNQEIADAVNSSFSSLGVKANISPKTSTSVDVRNIRNIESHNVRTYGGKSRRTNALTWNEWITVNNTLNDILDRHNAEANIHSLSGKFRIRQGRKRYTADDWDMLGDENVGSAVSPISRKDLVLSAKEAEKYGYSLSRRKLKKVI